MSDWYATLLRYPVALLVTFLIIAAIAISGVRDFRFDASADTLVVEGDPALAQYNEMATLFGGDDFIVVTYSADNIFTPQALSEIAALERALGQLSGIASTYSILDAPLIESPPIPVENLAEGYRTLRDASTDLSLARQELTNSPLISNYLISQDGETTAISATLTTDKKLEALWRQREDERAAGNHKGEASVAYNQHRQQFVADREILIQHLRDIRDNYSGTARLFISGIPMIAADMLSFVRSDLAIFSLLVLCVIVLLLTFFFRKPRWVLIPIFACLTTVGITMGLLGTMGTPVTVVSANFISLLSIISISFSIHLVVRYRELLLDGQDNHRLLVVETMESKFAPCIYTALTTILAFGSMLASDIVPIVDFGWMMCLGIVIAFITTYLLFPAILLILGSDSASSTIGTQIQLTEWFAELAVNKTALVAGSGLLLTLIAVYGVSLVTFDNRFIDYFKQETDIYQGMRQIDRHLGGTLPLDIYVRFEKFDNDYDDGDFFDGFEDDYPERYWFTPDKIDTLRLLQIELESYDEIGKVLSLASLEKMGRRFNDGNALTGLEMSYVLGELPADVRRFLIEPYARPAEGWMRVNARIQESESDFSKDELINSITHFARDEMQLREENLIVTGMVVLFNNMLNQLADSQIRTIGYVIAATFIMFSLLLGSIRLAAIAITPNILAAGLIIAFMGYANIPMDMMTVTIAAICIGIGVDDAIHYLHRFTKELHDANSHDANSHIAAVLKAHQTIGRAMYFTSVTIMAGFSILALSNFVPTIYFGLLTALSMILALVANMTLLPALLILFGRRSARSA